MKYTNTTLLGLVKGVMKTLLKTLALWHCFLVIANAQTIIPLPKAHAHNDYEHDRPLLDALAEGFCSVEADVFAIDGELRIGHYSKDTKPGRTLEKFYLDPLLERVQKNKGSVYADPKPFTLLIDFKTKAEPTYALLRKSLSNYKAMLKSKPDSKPAVQIVISGNRPFDLVQKDDDRLCGLDGRMGDLDSDLSAELMPLISDNWRVHFKWRGEGEFPDEERAKLTTAVEKAHAAGRRVRFWATPENENLWKELEEAGVDHINTDQLKRLRKFLAK